MSPRSLPVLFLSLACVIACNRAPAVPTLPPTSTPTPTTIPLPTPTPNWETSTGQVRTELVAQGLRKPLALVGVPDLPERLLVLQKNGVIRVIEKGAVLKTPFLDLHDQVAIKFEQGLQSLVFAPDFAASRNFYVSYNRRADKTLVVERYRVSDDPRAADRSSAQEIIAIPHPTQIHNGGQLHFGSDGYLYLSVGDGGGDPPQISQEAQTLNSLLGKILRLDVSTLPYKIPPTNPFVNDAGARPEIFAYGLRNPWRFTVDPATDEFYITDVGENDFEEVNVIAAAELAGKNFGWPRMEGAHCFPLQKECARENLILPVFEYPHVYGCAIIGGMVYHGKRFPALEGKFLFADFCFGRVWTLRRDDQNRWRAQELANLNKRITALAQTPDGSIYVLDLKKGELYRLRVE